MITKTFCEYYIFNVVTVKKDLSNYKQTLLTD